MNLKGRLTGTKLSWPEITWVPTNSLQTQAFNNNSADIGLDTATKDELAFLQFTSGSTSTPKGVMVTHGNLAHNLQTIIRSLYASDDTVVVSWLPQYHDMGLIGSHLGAMYVCVAFSCWWSMCIPKVELFNSLSFELALVVLQVLWWQRCLHVATIVYQESAHVGPSNVQIQSDTCSSSQLCICPHRAKTQVTKQNQSWSFGFEQCSTYV